jgi:hypothetical protein
MTVRRLGPLLALSAWALAAHGCGDDTRPEPDEKPRVCDPGTVFSCYKAGCKAHQSCNVDGTAMSSCTCDTVSQAGSGAEDDAGTSMPQPDAGEFPDSFEGPIEVRVANGAAPSCEGSFAKKAFEAGEAPEAGAASCSECTCAAESSACAAFVDFTTGTMAGCGGTTCTTSVNQSCTEISPPCLSGVTSAYLGTKLPQSGGSCKASEQKPSKPEVTWAKRVTGCSASCKQGQTCTPKRSTSKGVEVSVCIWREGEHDCPSDTYTDKRVYYRGVDDSRTCSACACEGASCGYTWSVFNAGDTACASPIIKLTSPDQCVQVNPAMDKLRVGVTLESDGTCTPSGGMSQGDVKGSDAVTVCCAE